jgi:hypothetical protein
LARDQVGRVKYPVVQVIVSFFVSELRVFR